jgi:hypothetical protein
MCVIAVVYIAEAHRAKEHGADRDSSTSRPGAEGYVAEASESKADFLDDGDCQASPKNPCARGKPATVGRWAWRLPVISADTSRSRYLLHS